MSAVFDSNVFDVTFDIFFGVPALLKVNVEPEFRRVLPGQVVIINAYIVNLASPSRRFLFNPDVPPTITILNPDRTIKVANGDMINTSVGVYQYRHQTGIQFDSLVFDEDAFDTLANDAVGVYTGFFTASDGNMFMHSNPQELYEVING